jgi:hypothetical protein
MSPFYISKYKLCDIRLYLSKISRPVTQINDFLDETTFKHEHILYGIPEDKLDNRRRPGRIHARNV